MCCYWMATISMLSQIDRGEAVKSKRGERPGGASDFETKTKRILQ